MTSAPDIDALVDRLNDWSIDGETRRSYATQCLCVEAAAALTSLQADLKAAQAENKALSDEIDALEEEGSGIDDDIRKLNDWAEAAEASLAEAREAMQQAMDIYQADDEHDIGEAMFMVLHTALTTHRGSE